MAETSVPYVIPLTNQKPKVITLVPNDPTSRYKTRQLQVQVVGKSKMIKTVLVNILDVSKDMQVPPPWIGTYCAYEIGAQAKFDAKKPERQQAFISGEHETKDLSRIVVQFVNEVVLCPRCGLPELLIHVEGDKKVLGNCRACGGDEELRISNEKFKRYVINHPPSAHKGAFAGNTEQKKKEKDSSKDKDAKKEEKEPKEKEKKPKTKKKAKEDDEEGVVWYTDTSDEAMKQRREAMIPKAIAAAVAPTDKAPVKKLSSEDIKKLISESPDDQSANSEKLLKLKKETSTGDEEFVKLLVSSLFTSNILSEIKKFKPVFQKGIVNEPCQLATLASVETFLEKEQPALVSKTPLIVKAFYDEDLLEEDAILTWWDNTPATSQVKKAAEPLVKWLREADDDDEEEEEDDE